MRTEDREAREEADYARIADRAMAPLEARIAELEAPYRNADALDWEQLFQMLPDSGHGKFWKAVMAEVRATLEK